jgi:hypothetical protein
MRKKRKEKERVLVLSFFFFFFTSKGKRARVTNQRKYADREPISNVHDRFLSSVLLFFLFPFDHVALHIFCTIFFCPIQFIGEILKPYSLGVSTYLSIKNSIRRNKKQAVDLSSSKNSLLGVIKNRLQIFID